MAERQAAQPAAMQEREEQLHQMVERLSKREGRVLLAPRFGKTRLVIELIRKDRPGSVLYVTPSRKLIEEDIPREFAKWGAKRFLKRITFCTWASLRKQSGRYSLIILDEEQKMTANNMRPILEGTLTGRIVTLTGTGTRSEEKVQILEQLNLEVLEEVSIAEAQGMQILSPYRIVLHRVELGIVKNILVSPKGGNPFYTSEKSSYYYLSNRIAQSETEKDRKKYALLRRQLVGNSEIKVERVMRILARVGNERTIIFCPTIAIAERVCKHTYHSKSGKQDLQAFERGEINRIAMVQSGAVGFTFRNVRHIIIMQVDMDRNGDTTQKICRGLMNDGITTSVHIIVAQNTKDTEWANLALLRLTR